MYTTKQMTEMLHISRHTFLNHLDKLPAPGTKVNDRLRIFTDEDIAANRAYFDSHVDSRNRGGRGKKRKINPAS